MRSQNTLFAIALVFGVASSVIELPTQAKTAVVKDAKAEAYKRSKKTMPPDLYLVYRVTERLLIANDIKRSIRVAVRNNVDCATAGVKTARECESLQLLPEIDRATNFDIWAAQVVGTMRGQANAFAMSTPGTLFINNAMLKELTGKIDQVACVLAHELAHITQNHSEETQKKLSQLDIKISEKISKAAKNAHNVQQANRALMATLGILADGLGGTNTNMNQVLTTFAMENMAAGQIAPQIAQQALNYSPEMNKAFNSMQGLRPDLVKRTMKDVDNYLRDHNLELLGFSRQLEYEADLLGVEYAKAAGFDAGACKLLWTETMPHDQDKLIARLLPKGVNDPMVEVHDTSKKSHNEGLSPDEIRKQSYEKSMAKKKEPESEKDNKKDSSQVPDDVLKLLQSHPDGLSRASAIDNHLSDKQKMSKIALNGSSRLKTNLVRNWSYDEQSKSTVISQELVLPQQAGLQTNGITGIDVDKQLGF